MKKTIIKLMMPLAAAICVAAAPLSSFAEAKSATLKATGYAGTTTLTGFQARDDHRLLILRLGRARSPNGPYQSKVLHPLSFGVLETCASGLALRGKL